MLSYTLTAQDVRNVKSGTIREITVPGKLIKYDDAFLRLIMRRPFPSNKGH